MKKVIEEKAGRHNGFIVDLPAFCLGTGEREKNHPFGFAWNQSGSIGFNNSVGKADVEG